MTTYVHKIIPPEYFTEDQDAARYIQEYGISVSNVADVVMLPLVKCFRPAYHPALGWLQHYRSSHRRVHELAMTEHIRRAVSAVADPVPTPRDRERWERMLDWDSILGIRDALKGLLLARDSDIPPAEVARLSQAPVSLELKWFDWYEIPIDRKRDRRLTD